MLCLLSQLPKKRADVVDQQVRFLHGRKVPAPRHPRPVHEVRMTLRDGSWDVGELAWKDSQTDWCLKGHPIDFTSQLGPAIHRCLVLPPALAVAPMVGEFAQVSAEYAVFPFVGAGRLVRPDRGA